MPDPPRLAAEISRHDADGRPEDTRLRAGDGLVELARTQEIVRRHLAPVPGLADGLDILDVGGASGIHASWLAADGHRVHVVDPRRAPKAMLGGAPRTVPAQPSVRNRQRPGPSPIRNRQRSGPSTSG